MADRSTHLGLATLLVLGAWPGCSRPQAAGDSSRGSDKPASSQLHGSAPVLTDWVRHPPVSVDEEGAGPRRIVSISPATTEWCCALGLRDRIVGRSRYCDYPPGIEAVPVLGSATDLSTEVLLSLKPDRVLMSGTTHLQRQRLESLKVPFVATADGDLEDILEAPRVLGEACARPKTAAAIEFGIRDDLARVTRWFRAQGVPSARVLLVVQTLHDPPTAPTVAGPGSFYDDLLRMSGCDNAVGSDGREFGPWSLEAIVRDDPDVIIELDPDGRSRPAGDADARAAWAKIGSLKAVRTGRVHVLTGNRHYLPGPRIAFTYLALCEAIARGDVRE